MSRPLPVIDRPSLRLRSVTAVAALAVELVGFSVRFDTGSLAGGGDEWWTAVLGQAPLLVRLAVTFAVTAVLFCGPGFLDEINRWPSPMTGRGRLVGLVVAHAVSVLSLYRLTELLLEQRDRSPEGSTGWFLGWVVAALTTVSTLALAVLPAGRWCRLAARLWPSLLVAAAVSLAAWGSGFVSEQFWEPLGSTTLWAVEGLVGLVAHPVSAPEVKRVGTETFGVLIAPECSGYEGIGLVIGFAGGYLWMSRSTLRFPHALLLLPLGAALAWGANAVRIAALILIGTWGSREVALGGFHSQAGWLSFNGIAFGLILLAHRVRLFRTATADGSPAERVGADPATAYLAPFLCLVATAMVTAALTAGFDWWYPARVVVVGGVLLYFRRSYPRLRWSWSAVGCGLLVFAAWAALEPPAPPTGVPAELAGLPTWLAAGWVTFRVVGSCLTVPLAEELAFRGYLTRRLIAARFDAVPPGTFTWASFLISSVLFGAMHGRWLAGTMAGLAYALAYYRRRELSDAALAHGTTNAAIAVWVLAAGRWEQWV